MKLGTNTISTVKLGTNQVQKVYLGTNEVWANTDPDYQAILDYATTQGYTLPSVGQQALQNQLVVDLKDAGVWSKLDTFAVFATDGNSDFALIDWIRLSQYTAVNSPTFTTNDGFEGNGTSSYIDTNFNPTIGTNNFTLNNACFGGVKNINISNDKFFCACSVTSNNLLRANSSTTNRINSGISGSALDFSPYNFIALHRNSSSNVGYSYDNIVGNVSRASVSIPNGNQWILRHNLEYANFGARMYFSGSNLISESPDFYNAWTNYFNAI
jgi:hypothetical protein